ncbi:oxidoreductase [Streptococcus pseudoporcinus]|uniref:Oxidoreductase n=1 Tax=Streptococcus pseudoporcinus TaxID=361101 RepID=A0A4U9ZLQ9_9STRE|nr:oxidoreductase [Streptococcus pseudoporcinus]
MNCQQIKGFVISHCRIEQLNKAAMTINSYFAEGKLLEDDIRIMTFDAAASAYQLLKEGAERKKLVLIP